MALHATHDGLLEAGRLAATRAKVYEFLSEQFVKKPVREDQSGGELQERWESFADVLDGSESRAIVGFFSSGDLSGERLNREFSDLFVVPAGRYLAPIESVYRGARQDKDSWQPGLLRGQAWQQVSEQYRQAGYMLPPQTGIEADHLGCELEFLALLCRAEQHAWLVSDSDAAGRFRVQQREFIEDHPLGWIDALRQRFSRVSQNPYYENLLGLVANHLRTEWEHLRDDS